ncbi:MAG: Hsp20/alpha crystallin family protein [Candidatus Hermodarchaeota archaeon]
MSEKGKIDVKKKEKINEEKKEDKKTREITVRRESPFSLFQEMDRMFNEMQRNFFDDWYWPFGKRRNRPFSLIIREDEPIFRTPLANITEDDKAFAISAELPGLDKGDIEISIQDGTLEIKGEVKEEKTEEREGELVRREYRSSSYYRAFSLPDNIDENNIDANLDKGILTVKIPKTEPVKPEKKTIEIK